MRTFLLIIAVAALGGGAGGLANYLLVTLPVGEKRCFCGALRFVTAGAIAAFAVPLFLSLAQSSLVKSIFDHNGPGQDDAAILIFLGFCVVAGFASRAFMSNMSARMMQIEQKAEKADIKAEMADDKAEKAGNKAEKADSTATEAMEISEEAADRAADATKKSSGEREVPTSAEPILPQELKHAPSPAALATAATLNDVERKVLNAMTRHSKRTQTGVARDAGVPRNTVSGVIDRMHDEGIVRYTTSATTGGLRVQLTERGTDVLNALTPLYRTGGATLDPAAKTDPPQVTQKSE